MSRVIVIGAGPAGMMAAYAAAKNGNRVTLLERNEKPGKKLYITGKGRCNLTNTAQGDAFLQQVVSNPKFLHAAIRRFSPADTVAFFESRGVRLKVERGNRVFPASDKASDITACLLEAVEEQGVELRLNTQATHVWVEEGAVAGVIVGRQCLPCDYVIVATGGVSYPATGSTGWGAEEAGRLHLDTVPWASALCAVNVDSVCGIAREKLPYPQGLSLKNVSLSLKRGQKTLRQEFGEMLFTQTGVSGPIVLRLSSYMNRLALQDCTLVLDLKPALDETKLDERVLRDFAQGKNRMFKNSLHALLPAALIDLIVQVTAIPPEKPLNALSRSERGALVRTLKGVEFSGLQLDGVEKGVVSAGGVAVSELKPGTMESKKIARLKFAGETVDVDALTGGFNIQIALSTGFLAGDSIGKEKE